MSLHETYFIAKINFVKQNEKQTGMWLIVQWSDNIQRKVQTI